MLSFLPSQSELKLNPGSTACWPSLSFSSEILLSLSNTCWTLASISQNVFWGTQVLGDALQKGFCGCISSDNAQYPMLESFSECEDTEDRKTLEERNGQNVQVCTYISRKHLGNDG